MLVAALSTIAAIAAVGAAGNALFNATKKQPKAPTPPPIAPPPTPVLPDRQLGARRQRALGASGPQPTLLTGPAGLNSPATITRNTLLGQ